MEILANGAHQIKVLVSAVGGDIGTSVAKILYESGKHVTGCDIKDNPTGRQFIDDFFISPPAKLGTQFVKWALSICIEQNISLFIPINEIEIAAVSSESSQFDKYGIKVLIIASPFVEIFLDKYKTERFLREEVRLKTPKSFLLSEFENQLSFPLIAKPRSGRGGHGNCRIDDEFDLRYAQRKFKDGNYIIQEYIGEPDQEYTTAIFSNRKLASSITFRRQLGFGGLSSEVELVSDPEMESNAATLASAINLYGSINVQSRKMNGKHYIFEINPRISSTALFRHFFGFKDVLWWCESLTGTDYTYTKNFKSGIGKRLLNEVYFNLSD